MTIKVGGVTREVWVILQNAAHFRSNACANCGFSTPVTGGEGMIHLTVYGPQSHYRKSHHL